MLKTKPTNQPTYLKHFLGYFSLVISFILTISFPLEAHHDHSRHHGNNHGGYGHCGTSVVLNVPSSIWVGNHLKNRGEITLTGEGIIS